MQKNLSIIFNGNNFPLIRVAQNMKHLKRLLRNFANNVKVAKKPDRYMKKENIK